MYQRLFILDSGIDISEDVPRILIIYIIYNEVIQKLHNGHKSLPIIIFFDNISLFLILIYSFSENYIQ